MRFNTPNRPCEAVGVEEINGLVQNAKGLVVEMPKELVVEMPDGSRYEMPKGCVQMPNAVNANAY